ncbi:hypothetical protein [Janthinobacterium lividum]|uniref:hypothetical protein n=1 Tax=Janthinobacterium lividum TaxID=29581 RepID=UPI00140E5E1F|nr:hypothetical protein [Janthinobacterium lividum]NHQ90909.1 hypothetical protein [Janthinobacterium lividum]
MAESPYHAARVILQAKWFAIAKIGVALAALWFQFVLIRNLSVADYVSFTIFTAANGLLVFATMFGMDRVVYRFMPPLREAMRWREMLLLMAGLIGVRQLAILLLLLLFWGAGQLVLPAPILAEVRLMSVQYALFAVATAFTDTFAIFCNSLGQQGRQAILQTSMTFLRIAVIIGWLAWHGALDAFMVADVMIVTESLLAATMLAVLAREFFALRGKAPAAGPLVFGFTWKMLIGDSLGTQMTYMLSLPFRGGLLKLIVGAIATPVATASFGFFQTIADRAYQFMPIFMMKGMIEPALASDFAVRGDFARIRLMVSLLIRLNFVILGLGMAILLGCGVPLVDWMTHGRYGSESWIAIMLLLQLGAMTLGEALWIGLNPIGRIGPHNRIWIWVSIVCYAAIGLAAWLRNIPLLIVVSAIPYLLVFATLRWIQREPLLLGGLGMGAIVRLAVPVGAAAMTARLACWLLAAWPVWGVLAAVAGSVLVYYLVLRKISLFYRDEVDSVSTVSPRLARMFMLISAR